MLRLSYNPRVIVACEPAVPPTRAMPGTGRLRCTNVNGGTRVTRAFAVSPLKFLNPKLPGQAAWVYTATYGGGLVDGDAIDLDVEVDEGAHAVVTTQASTKVYRSTRESSQRLHARVGRNALLVVAPDPVVCFAGARYRQEQTFDLDASASLVFVDWITAGRHRSGERWAFARYASRLAIRRARHLVVYDAVVLDPADGPVDERMGRFNCLATAVFTGPRAHRAALASPRTEGLLTSAAPLSDDGTIVKLAAESAQDAAEVLSRMIEVIHGEVGSDPWAGKW